MAPTEEELKNIPSLDDTPEEMENRKWATRRKMAWVALTSMVILMFILLTPIVGVLRVEKLQDVFTWFFISMSSLVGSYFGLSTFSHLGKK